MHDNLQDNSVQCNPIPVIAYNERRAADAYSAYQAMALAQIANPKLADNPAWAIVRDHAFENFMQAFEVMS